MHLHAVKQWGVLFAAILLLVWPAVFVNKNRMQQTARTTEFIWNSSDCVTGSCVLTVSHVEAGSEVRE
ncbi:MAG TPA: hypothetical protein DEF45_00740 [Rhodopirellula sp.]|nr:hypothetical protein [Rhodopirellula sp.]